MPIAPAIQTHEVSKVFHHPFFYWLVRARAVSDLTFSVAQGEVFGLLGPNGSGKSTTIKMILGLLFPTEGQVAVFNRRPEDLAVKSRIGFLPEESYFYRYLTAQETLDFYARLFNMPASERVRRIDALLEMTGLMRERNRPLAEFSKGMQRRIGIAQALINDPDLVILDEPTTGLDPLGTREVKDLILELKRKGKTVLLSSHLLADVEDVCDRILVLYGGRARAAGSVQEVLAKKTITQITSELDEETLKAVLEVIRQRKGESHAVEVAPPTENLEQFFLRVVHEAQSQQAETSGVQAATGRLDFLTQARHEEGEGLLDDLVRGEREREEFAPEESQVHVVETASQQSQALVSALAAGSGESSAEEEQPDEEEAPPVENRSVLDKLVQGENAE